MTIGLSELGHPELPAGDTIHPPPFTSGGRRCRSQPSPTSSSSPKLTISPTASSTRRRRAASHLHAGALRPSAATCQGSRRSLDVVRGNRVALMAENGPHWPTVEFASCHHRHRLHTRLVRSL